MGKPEKRHSGQKTSDHAHNKGGVKKAKFQHGKYKNNPIMGVEGAGNRQRAVIRQYRKMQHKDKKAESAHIPTKDFKFGGNDAHSSNSKAFGYKKGPNLTKSRFHKEEQIKQQKQEEKIQQQTEKEEAYENRKQALQNYKLKKRQNFKKLAKVNYKGQPNLSAQMELLLGKIEKQKYG